jgi:hypothetical protein
MTIRMHDDVLREIPTTEEVQKRTLSMDQVKIQNMV